MSDSIRIPDTLTEKQKAILEEVKGKHINEKELCEKLGMDEASFEPVFKAFTGMKEQGVFSQTLSDAELTAISGGEDLVCHNDANNNCSSAEFRDIYGGSGFANCGATVEDGSWCNRSDACVCYSVKYINKQDCSKAWR